jgi:ligand-binding sensor domain-containing protein
LLAAATEAAAVPNPRFTGSPFLRVWTPDEYQASPENHCVVQHPLTHFIYVGNGSGVLEFDGVHWRRVAAPGGGPVQSLAIDSRGRIWGCGGEAIFRLEPDGFGGWRAQSVLDRLPEEHRSVAQASQCVATSAGLWFKDQKRLLFFGLDDGPARVWRVAAGTHSALRLWLIEDDPYVMISGNDVFRVRAGELEAVPSLRNTVWKARATGDGAWQLATSSSVDRWDGTTVQRDGPLFADGAQAATFLADGRIVFGTVREGLVVCDREGRRQQKLDRTHGLPGNLITGVAEDHEGGVWATSRFGLARVQLDSPYARHGPRQGVEGTVHAIVKIADTLFVGGTEGAARRESDGLFRPIEGIPGPDRQIVAHDGWLYSLSYRLRALRPAEDKRAVELENRNYLGLLPLAAAPGWFAHGSNEGLRWAGFDEGKWRSEGPASQPRGRTVALLEAPAGFVWSVSQGRLWQSDFRGGLKSAAPARSFGVADGLVAAPTTMFVLGGEIVALSAGRLLRFDANSGRFQPETRVAGLEDIFVEQVCATGTGGWWLLGGPEARRVYRVVPTGTGRWMAERLDAVLHRVAPTTLYEEASTQTLWIGGHGVLVSRDLNWSTSRSASPPVARIRHLDTLGDGRRFEFHARGDAAHAALQLSPRDVALRIRFAAATFAPDHNGATHTEYRTRLGGLETEWSAWSNETERDFTNLPWRTFTFEVQARDTSGRIGPAEQLVFTLRPAWWATPWAWAGYSALGVAAFAGLVGLRTRTLRRRNTQLEAIVATRTRELVGEKALLAANNAELARLQQVDRDERIAAQLAEEKARLEVLRYQLNPHFLYNSLNSVYGLLFDNSRAAGEMVLRLSDFCRATLTSNPEPMPTLGSQIAVLRLYLEIEKVRWGDNLQVEFDVAHAATHVPLPPSLLLPLVENAVKYGSRTSPGVLTVRLFARLGEQSFDSRSTPAEENAGRVGSLHIEVANSGTWVEPSSDRADSSHIGLENLRLRLHRYYPSAHAFSIEAKPGWVVARLRVALQPRGLGPLLPHASP